MGTSNLLLQSIHVAFGESKILTDLSFRINEGEAKFIVGPNGSGKTTLFNVIAGVVRQTQGTVMLGNREVSSLPSHLRCQAGIVRSFQIPCLSPALTALDHVLISIRGSKPLFNNAFHAKDSVGEMQQATQILEDFGLSADQWRNADTLTHSQRKLLDVACVFAARPRLALLDEPSSGIDESEKKLLAQAILARPKNTTMLLIEHDMEFVNTLGFPVAFLSDGHIFAEGGLDYVKALPEAADVYF